MKKRVILFIFLLVVIIAVFIGWKLFGPTANAPAEKYFYVRTGSAYDDVKRGLEQKKIIDGTFWFDKVAGYLHYSKSVKPGRYKIDEGMSLVSLVRMLRSGKQAPVNFVITKLRTKEELAKRIGENFECDSVSVSRFLYNTDTLS